MTKRLLALLLASSAALACSSSAPSSSSETDVGSTASPIINGTTSTTAQDSVVLLVIYQGGQPAGTCTGTLVAPNLVLTAHHCVSETDEQVACNDKGKAVQGGAVISDRDPTQIYVYTGVSAAQHADSKTQAAAHGTQAIVDNKTLLCNDDLAFLVLNKAITTSPTAPMRLTGGARENESLTSVGWGLTESGQLPGQRQQRTGVIVQYVGPVVLDAQSGLGLGDAEFLVPESICSGDSGGPALSSKGAIVGVVSRGGGGGQSTTNEAANCIGNDVFNFYTQLNTKTTFINSAFATAGATPRDEGAAPGKITGESCTADIDCSSFACVKGVCVARCDNGETCPDNEQCKATTSIKYCAPGTTTAPAPAATDPTTSDDPAADTADETPAPTTTTTTTTGCSTAPGSSGSTRTPTSAALLLLGVLALRRRPASGRRRS